ncbi:hypothetical protein EVAR_12846_1 [Eumeta japonica]|uniref:Uncharacterized protein n=1 Tax=Eumeta variegata TaxID=151549 RepID=A0A4C1UAU2_EUMVA|nr:hypothetical protein EVAR_12846_1 [Eumeta japonica]
MRVPVVYSLCPSIPFHQIFYFCIRGRQCTGVSSRVASAQGRRLDIYVYIRKENLKRKSLCRGVTRPQYDSVTPKCGVNKDMKKERVVDSIHPPRGPSGERLFSCKFVGG